MITVTEILGTDALNASRITINSNFSVCAGAINSLLNIISISESAASIGNGDTQYTGSRLTLGAYTLDATTLGQLLELLNQQGDTTDTQVEP